jgi:hypothetical protein
MMARDRGSRLIASAAAFGWLVVGSVLAARHPDFGYAIGVASTVIAYAGWRYI